MRERLVATRTWCKADMGTADMLYTGCMYAFEFAARVGG